MTKTFKLSLIGGLVLACSSYVAYDMGQHAAKSKGRRELASVSLLAVEPAVRLSELHASSGQPIPRGLLVEAEGAILLVAHLSVMFSDEIATLPSNAREVLCVIAKNRERHRSFHAQDNFYDEALMAHLKTVHESLVPGVAASRTACKLPDLVG